jgi:hypothetical protein
MFFFFMSYKIDVEQSMKWVALAIKEGDDYNV